MTGMHVREPRPCTSPLRGEHSGYKGPTTELGLERPNFCFKAILGQFQVKFGVSSVTQNGV